MVFDTFHYDNDSINFSLFATSYSMNIDANMWHVRLRHVGQGRMNRLTHKGFLGTFTKFELPICEHYLIRKTIK